MTGIKFECLGLHYKAKISVIIACYEVLHVQYVAILKYANRNERIQKSRGQHPFA